MRVGEQHRQPVHSQPHPARWRHPITKRPNIVEIHLVRFFVAALAFFLLRLVAPPLIFRVVQFAEAVGDFHLPNEYFKALGPVGIVRLLF